MLYTGLDLHKSFSYITTMNDKGEIVGQKKLPSNGEILDFLKGFEDSIEVAIEATPSWYGLYDCLEDEGLIDPFQELPRSSYFSHLSALLSLHFVVESS